jgi:PAS domain S-box-containing protein
VNRAIASRPFKWGIIISARMQLQEENRQVEEEIAARKRFDAAIETPLRRKVTVGFIVAVLLTIFIGVSSWRGARRAEQDGDWVSHTHEVMEAIQRTFRHVLEAETSARAFALTGQERLLAGYPAARDSISQDEDALRHLTADNRSQQRRLDVLEPQVRSALAFADSIIAERRKSQPYSGSTDAIETQRLIEVVRATTRDMYAEEKRLLIQRTQTAQSGQRLTRVIAIIGAFFGGGLWVLAKLAVNREINVSARARAQLTTLNAELEQRVEQRTAALESEIVKRELAGEALKKSLATSEQALKELADQKFALEHLAAVVNWSDDAIIGKDLNGTINAWNRGAEKIFGYAASEIIGKPMLILFPPERAKEEIEFLARIRRGESVEHFETVRVRKDGTAIDVSVTVSPIRDGNGVIVGASKIARDITERKKAEAALREMAQTLELAQVLVRDMQGRIVLWTRGAETLYGFTREEAMGCIAHELLQTDFPEPLAQIEKKLQRLGSWEGELVHLKRDHTRIRVSSLWVLHRDAQGNPLRILEANVDITARKQAELLLAGQTEELSRKSDELVHSQQALEAQTLLLQSVLNSMVEGLVAVDERGKFIIWNPAATKIIGMGAENVPPGEWNAHYGVYLPDMVTPFPPEQNPLIRAIHGEMSTADIYVRNPEVDHGVWIEASGGPLKNKSGGILGGVVAFRDITQRRAAELEIRKLNEELEERVAQRTAQLEAANHELEAFTYSVSHDLRAPLRHIGGFSKILSEDFGSGMPPEARNHLERIADGAHRMGLLVDELLNLARLGRHPLHLRSTGLNSIIEEVVSLLQPEVGDRAITWKIADLPSVECDPVLIKQVFQNLIANALKFTRTRERAIIEIRQQEENGQMVIAVSDNGVGFNMKYKDKLFGVFQRLHRAEDFEGTGIGLATVQRIVRKHGGQVWADAELDKGATFYFTLGTAASGETKTENANSSGSNANEVQAIEIERSSVAAGGQA